VITRIRGLFDVVLMDYQMPNMDGPTAIKAIRQLGYGGIIMGLTGNAMQCDQDMLVWDIASYYVRIVVMLIIYLECCKPERMMS